MLTLEKGVTGVWFQHVGAMPAAGLSLPRDSAVAGQRLRDVIHTVHL